MPRGGKRPNAGRPKKYGPGYKIALINEVGSLKAQNPLWNNQRILDELEQQGKLKGNARSSLTRLLETRYNVYQTPDGEVDIREILTTDDRSGILGALPTLPIKK